MMMMEIDRQADHCTAVVGDVQGVRAEAIARWTRQVLKFREADVLMAEVVSAFDMDMLTMTATVVLWTEVN